METGPPEEAAPDVEPKRPSANPRREPLRLSDLDRAQRQRAVFRTAATIIVAWVLILGAYYLIPFTHLSGARSVLRLVAVVALVGVVLALEIRRISTAELPELRAVEALGIVIIAFLAGFSTVYLNLSHGTAATFTKPLDHTKALYFTITVFSTVGFGDITPRTDTARLIVSAQMLLDLVIIGAVVRLILNAARIRIGPGQASPGAGTGVDGAQL